MPDINEVMELKVKECVVYIRKHLLTLLVSVHRFSCNHPFASSFTFSLLLLYLCFPSLFSLLVASFPVLSCTALLLGILLSYGEPNVPVIEEDDRVNQEVSSLNVEKCVPGLFVKKDESCSSVRLVESGAVSNDRMHKDSFPVDDNKRENDFNEKSNKRRFEENFEVLTKEQSESHMRNSEVPESVSEGIENLKVKIKRQELDDWLDCSLGSPWQPINMHDSSSSSESDGVESSSPDASMSDILPMLEELHPLLDSKVPLHSPKSGDKSDLELSQHHGSDEDSVEREDEQAIKEKDEGNEVVTWTADDRKNVMDLGSSDLERNQRLENLIARRRARKNQILIFEKDFINLQCKDTTTREELFCFHPKILPILAPRINPFDFPHDSNECNGLPPIPGSAPSVLLGRKNPFDFSCNSLAGESFSQPELRLPSQRGTFFQGHESFALHSPLSGNLMHEKHGFSRLDPYLIDERTDSKGDAYTHFSRHSSGNSDTKASSIAAALESSPSLICLEDQKVSTEQDMQESISFPFHFHSTISSEQYKQDDLADSQHDFGEDGHSVDPNAFAVNEETYKERVDNFEAAASLYDSSTTGSANILANNSVPADSHEGELEESITSKMIEFDTVHGSMLHDLTSIAGETFMNLLDENVSASMSLSETGEEDYNNLPGFEGFTDRKTSSEIDHLAEETEKDPSFISSFDFPSSSGFEEKLQFLKEFDESHISNLDLEPPHQENSVGFKVDEENLSLDWSATTSGLHKLENLDNGLLNRSNEEAPDEDNEGLAFLFEKAKPSTILDIGDSQDAIINEFHINRVIHLDHEDANAVVTETYTIDENLLSELDDVGDFRTDELKSKELLQMESQPPCQLDCSSEDSEPMFSSQDAEFTPNNPILACLINPDEMDLVLDQKKSTDSDLWSLATAHTEDLTVYKPKLNVLQAFSPEELELPSSETVTDNLEAKLVVDTHSAFELVTEIAHEHVITHPVVDATEEDAVTSNFQQVVYDNEVMALNSIMTQIEPELLVFDSKYAENIGSENNLSQSEPDHESLQTSIHSEQLVSEVKLVKERSSGLKQVSLVDFEAEETYVTEDTMPLGMVNDSEMLSFDTKSIELLNPDFKHDFKSENRCHEHGAVNERPPNANDKQESFSLESMSFEDKHLASRVDSVDVLGQSTTVLNNVKSPDSCNTSDSPILIAESIEDLNLAFTQATKDCLSRAVSKVDAEDNKCSELILEEKPIETIHSADNKWCSELMLELGTKNDSGMLLIEANSINDIKSAFEQVNNVPAFPLNVDTGSLYVGSESSSKAIAIELVELVKEQVSEENNEKALSCQSGGTCPKGIKQEHKQDAEEEYDKEPIVASDVVVSGESEDQISRRIDGQEDCFEDPIATTLKKKSEKS